MSKTTDPRRRFLQSAAALTGATALSRMQDIFAQATPPAVVTAESLRPQIPSGVMSGDVNGASGMIWSRADRPSRMMVAWSYDASLKGARRISGPVATEGSDFTARLDLTNLAAGREVFYRVQFQSLDNARALSAPTMGRFKTASKMKRDITFAFSGDEAGQGFGINEAFGGYRVYEEMRKFAPDFFIHSGDQIYADGPLKSEVKLPDGTIWKNRVTPEKSKVAESLAEFRGNYAYNLLDASKLRFAAEVPFLVQWDDHDVHDNWYPGQILEDARYQERNIDLLAARAKQAMFEYTPMRLNPADPGCVYRSFRQGPSLEVFMLDERSYRSPNNRNRQTEIGEDAKFLGRPQMTWLKKALKQSTATWKVIASDMPLSLIVQDLNPDFSPRDSYEAWANGDDGAPSGRELELAELLRFVKAERIRNLVWVTADVHYAQATYYNPVRAPFSDFDPFWEFVAGPLNAGTFGPNKLDLTFGPEIKYVSVPPGNPMNRAPSVGQQYFGIAKIDGKTEAMRVSLHDLYGKELYTVTLAPEA